MLSRVGGFTGGGPPRTLASSRGIAASTKGTTMGCGMLGMRAAGIAMAMPLLIETCNAAANRCFVGGGDGNTSSGHPSAVLGGVDHTASGQYAAVGGGRLQP